MNFTITRVGPMCKGWFILCMGFSLLMTSPVHAGERKHFELGIASYSSVVSNDEPGIGNDEYSGVALYLNGAITNFAAIRFLYAMLKHEDESVNSNITELSLLFGNGLGHVGWKIYAGPGLFNDRQTMGGSSYNFNGRHSIAGIGYDTNSVSLDAWLTIRDPSDYEDFIGVDVDVVSYAISISVRF